MKRLPPEGEFPAKITHIAIKVDDIEKTSAFYESVFGFKHVNTVRRRAGLGGDHVSRHSRTKRILPIPRPSFTISASKSTISKRCVTHSWQRARRS